ncbi:glycosyltransferase family 2 protein [Candidatus Microgenomates bacterium]|nr:glycosyltransferase family 2 protein [Candidatus Microgenomates bacterium]
MTKNKSNKNKPMLSVVLATRNEEENIKRCLESVSDIADEIIVVDEHSTDKTVERAKSHGAKVFLEPHHNIFHITKQKALDKASGEWILQLDADEVVTAKLGREILAVVNKIPPKVNNSRKAKLFKRHQELIQQRDGAIGTESGEVVGYFLPRANMFLGKPLIHAGVYPDGVIRLVKNGYAKFPQLSVHEQIKLDGKVGWLENDLLHYDSPTLTRYFARMNRYTDLKAQELKKDKTRKNIWSFLIYTVYKPIYTFVILYFRHKGVLDGVAGFLWSFFSALHFPVGYWKYMTSKYN